MVMNMKDVKAVPKLPEGARQEHTITVRVTSLADTWSRAGEQIARQTETGAEFANFEILARKLVSVPKREIDGQRLAEAAAKDSRIQAALAAAALRGDEEPDD